MHAPPSVAGIEHDTGVAWSMLLGKSARNPALTSLPSAAAANKRATGGAANWGTTSALVATACSSDASTRVVAIRPLQGSMARHCLVHPSLVLPRPANGTARGQRDHRC